MQRRNSDHQRGSFSLLSVLWIAFTMLGVVTINRATHVVHQRAFAQESADSIALAAAIGGPSSARALEDVLNVTITQLDITDTVVVVHVNTGKYSAISSASKSS